MIGISAPALANISSNAPASPDDLFRVLEGWSRTRALCSRAARPDSCLEPWNSQKSRASSHATPSKCRAR